MRKREARRRTLALGKERLLHRRLAVMQPDVMQPDAAALPFQGKNGSRQFTRK
jgi:hypothetical protein